MGGEKEKMVGRVCRGRERGVGETTDMVLCVDVCSVLQKPLSCLISAHKCQQMEEDTSGDMLILEGREGGEGGRGGREGGEGGRRRDEGSEET